MRFLLFFFLFFPSKMIFANAITTVYFFPGQGSDERLFSKIKLDSLYKIVHITYPVPEKNCSMEKFAKELSKQVDTTGKYIFVGVSLGGMICTELAEFMKPEKIIIISSAKSRKELPFRYRFQKAIPVYRIIPKRLMKLGARILQPIVEPDRKKHKEVFKSMLKKKSPLYYKRTVGMIINWKREKTEKAIIQINGTNDHTIPIRNLDPDYRIKKGSHMMTLTRGEEINTLLCSILKKEKAL